METNRFSAGLYILPWHEPRDDRFLHDYRIPSDYPPRLSNQEAHLWIIEDTEKEDALLVNTLNEEEKRRASQMLIEGPRHNFIVSRAFLRQVLSYYINISPIEIVFEYGPLGKPHLIAEQNPKRIQFSLSHAGNKTVLLIGNSLHLGIDVENLDRKKELRWKAITRRFFHPAEAELLDVTDSTLAPELFIKLWTIKEALIKAEGLGVGYIPTLPDATAFAVRDEIMAFCPFSFPPQYQGFSVRLTQEMFLAGVVRNEVE